MLKFSSQPSAEEIEGAGSSAKRGKRIYGSLRGSTEAKPSKGICAGGRPERIESTGINGTEGCRQFCCLFGDYLSFGLHHNGDWRDSAGSLDDTTVAHEGEILA